MKTGKNRNKKSIKEEVCTIATQLGLWTTLTVLSFNPKCREVMKNTKQYAALSDSICEALNSTFNLLLATSRLKKAGFTKNGKRRSVEDRAVFQRALVVSCAADLGAKLEEVKLIFEADFKDFTLESMEQYLAEKNQTWTALAYLIHVLQFPEKHDDECSLELKEINAHVLLHAKAIAEHTLMRGSKSRIHRTLTRVIIMNLDEIYRSVRKVA